MLDQHTGAPAVRPFAKRTYLGISVIAVAVGASSLGYGPAYFGVQIPGLTHTAAVSPAKPTASTPPQADKSQTIKSASDVKAGQTTPRQAGSAKPGASHDGLTAPATPAVVAALTPLPGASSAVDAIATATTAPGSAPDTAPGAAYAPTTTAPQDAGATRAPALAQALYPPLPERADAAALRSALEAYRAGDLAKGDEAARNALDDIGRTTLEWAALRLQAKAAGYGRIAAFIDKNTD